MQGKRGLPCILLSVFRRFSSVRFSIGQKAIHFEKDTPTKHLRLVSRPPATAQMDAGQLITMLAKILQAVGAMMVTKEENTQGPYDW